MVNNVADYGNDVQFVNSPSRILLKARSCIKGESYSESMTCDWCAVGTYLLVAQVEPGQCNNCISNAICYGGNEIVPMPGYYRFDLMSPRVTVCPNYEACLGGSQTNFIGECAKGYQGG